MASLDNNSSIQENTNIYKNEINLMDYFYVLWNRKWFIALASILPALVVAIAMFLSPRDYKISYTYDIALKEKDFRTLEDKFYSTENLEKLIQQFKKNNLNDYAKKIRTASNTDVLSEFISFKVSPSYFGLLKISKVKNFNELEKLQQAAGTLLIMQVVAQSKKDIKKIASIYKNNFEQIMPLYLVKEDLAGKMITDKDTIAAIEESKYTLDLNLERKKVTLKELKKAYSENSDELQTGVTLQFNDVSQNSDFLPLSYQLQAAETQLIKLQEQIRANKERYDYCSDLLKLNENLFNHLAKTRSSNYTVQQFAASLKDLLTKYKDNNHLQDYLKAYIKRIENKIAAVTPMVENPKVNSIAKGTARKSFLVFIVTLMLAIFIAFFLESIERNSHALGRS